MGSIEQLDVTQTAALLGVTRKHINRLVREGLLTPRYARGKGLNAPMSFSKADVTALASSSRKEFSLPQLRMRLIQTSAATRQLEKRVEALERLLGQTHWAVSLDEDSVINLYVRARSALHLPTNHLDDVMGWARVFLSLTEEYFDILEALTEDSECWKVFFSLGQTLAMQAPPENAMNPEERTAYGYLDAGRRNVRNLSFFFIRNRYGKQAANKAFNIEDDDHQEVLAVLTSMVSPDP